MINKFYIIVLLNVVIGLFYYMEHLDAGYTSLSGDNNNIIPVCQKKDNPELFKKDLYLNRLDNVKYYTPFYVNTLRFIKGATQCDYITATKILFLIIHVIYGVLWYLLFYHFYKSFWISLALSLMIRGIVWLPGMEMWGISDLWTLMPRTVYAALMPIPFLLMNVKKNKVLVLSAFLIGLIFNFHPITGLGGILIYMIMISFKLIGSKTYTPVRVATLGFFVFLGMFPFILSYFQNTDNTIVNQELFSKAFNLRIPAYFNDPVQFFKLWFKVRSLFFLLPIIILMGISVYHNAYRKIVKQILIIVILLLILPNLSFYIEKYINSLFHINLRMSFQLLRIQKLAILPSYFAIGFILLFLKNKAQFFRRYLPGFVVLYVVLLIISKHAFFSKVPYIGDDITRTILPNNLSIGKLPYGKNNNDLEKILEFINNNTPKDALFVGSHVIRSACKRSVQFDSKGASMLIEGNQNQFIEWYKNKNFLKKINQREKIEFYKRKGVTYIVTENKYKDLIPLFTSGNLMLYKI